MLLTHFAKFLIVLCYLCYQKADLDHNGVLNCEEFMTILVHLKKISNEEQLHKAFHHFDKNRNGYIEFDELKECLFDGHMDPHNEKMVHEIIVDADLDKVCLQMQKE